MARCSCTPYNELPGKTLKPERIVCERSGRQACRRMHEEVLYMYVQGSACCRGSVERRGRASRQNNGRLSSVCLYLHTYLGYCT